MNCNSPKSVTSSSQPPAEVVVSAFRVRWRVQRSVECIVVSVEIVPFCTVSPDEELSSLDCSFFARCDFVGGRFCCVVALF